MYSGLEGLLLLVSLLFGQLAEPPTLGSHWVRSWDSVCSSTYMSLPPWDGKGSHLVSEHVALSSTLIRWCSKYLILLCWYCNVQICLSFLRNLYTQICLGVSKRTTEKKTEINNPVIFFHKRQQRNIYVVRKYKYTNKSKCEGGVGHSVILSKY